MSARILHKVETGNGTEVELIGVAFSWSIIRDEFERDAVLKAFENAGMKTDVVRELKPKSVFIRAIRKAAQENLVHEIEETERFLRFQFDRKVVEDDGDEVHAKFITEAVISYDKQDDIVYTKNNEVGDLVRKLLGDCAKVYSKTEISKFIMNYFIKLNSNGLGKLIPMRRAGGAYFVSGMYIPEVYKCEQMLREIDPSSQVTIIEVCDTKRSKETVQDAFNFEIQGDIEELNAKLEKLETEGKDMSKTVYKNMMEDVAFLNERIEMFQELLQFKAAEAANLLELSKAKVKDYFLS